MTTSIAPVIEDAPAKVADPWHMHLSWDGHRIKSGCTSACGHKYRRNLGPGVRGGIPQDACSTCAGRDIFGGGVICAWSGWDAL